MATLQQKIAQRFLDQLIQSKEFDASKLDELRNLLAQNKRPKVDDFIQIFSRPAGGDLK